LFTPTHGAPNEKIAPTPLNFSKPISSADVSSQQTHENRNESDLPKNAPNKKDPIATIDNRVTPS
jgi:hypothetical protein